MHWERRWSLGDLVRASVDNIDGPDRSFAACTGNRSGGVSLPTEGRRRSGISEHIALQPAGLGQWCGIAAWFIYSSDDRRRFHATFPLPVPYRQLVGRVGLADDIGSERPWSTQTFRVLGDGRELWQSRPIRSPDDLQTMEIDIQGVRQLELVVDCPDSDRFAHDVWIEPRLTGGPPADSKPSR